MFNVKACGIAAGTAFLLSLLIGLLSGTVFLVLIFRALFFAALFFGLAFLVFWLVNQFVPELLSGGDDDLDIAPGSRVNISVGGSMAGAFPTDHSDAVDDIGSPRTSDQAAPLDQNPNAGYTGKRDPSPAETGDSPEGFGGLSAGPGGAFSPGGQERAAPGSAGGGLPDMDAFSEAAEPGTLGSAKDGILDTGPVFDVPEPKRKTSSGSGKNNAMGDFNPKELAQAIQTVLKREEKG